MQSFIFSRWCPLIEDDAWFLVQQFCQVWGSHLISLLYICLGVQKITVCRREVLNTIRLGQQQGGRFPNSYCCFLWSDFVLTLTYFRVNSNIHKYECYYTVFISILKDPILAQSFSCAADETVVLNVCIFVSCKRKSLVCLLFLNFMSIFEWAE